MPHIASNRQVQSIGIRGLQFVVHAEVNGIGPGITVQAVGEGLGKSAASGTQSVKSPAREVRLREVGVTRKARDSRSYCRGFETSCVGEGRGHTERARPVERGQ